jgi:predicted ATP-grasp superfamily ATP-dependent carboligase
MDTIFVTDGRSRASVAIIRSLGMKGLNIISGESYPINPSFFSRFVKKRVIYPDPRKNPDMFLDFILQFIRKNKVDMIIPVRDDATLILSKNREEIDQYSRIVVGEYATLMKARDKAETIRIAKAEQVPHPYTQITETSDQIDTNLNFPLILKPRKSSGSRGISLVNTEAELFEKYEKISKIFGPPMIQEFIPYGGAIGVSMLFNKGQPRAIFTHKRIREYPRSGGPSTLRESIRHQDAEKNAIKLLEAMNWHGVAMVEFRIDSRDGIPKLMEINPRFWGSLSLAINAGVDFPDLLYEMGKDGDIKQCTDYQLGVKNRWLIGDLLWLLSSRNKRKDFFEFMHFSKIGSDEFILNDPLPLLGAFLEGGTALLKREKRKHSFERGWE